MLPSRYANGVYSYPCIRDRKKVDKERREGEGAARDEREEGKGEGDVRGAIGPIIRVDIDVLPIFPRLFFFVPRDSLDYYHHSYIRIYIPVQNICFRRG